MHKARQPLCCEESVFSRNKKKGSGDESPAVSKGGAFGRRRPFPARGKATREVPTRLPRAALLFPPPTPVRRGFLPDARAHASEDARTGLRATPSLPPQIKGTATLFRATVPNQILRASRIHFPPPAGECSGSYTVDLRIFRSRRRKKVCPLPAPPGNAAAFQAPPPRRGTLGHRSPIPHMPN